MQLTQIDIKNFVCFKNFKAEFTADINVIIGRNGAGKSSLIRALVYTMNFMFTNDKSMGNNYLSAGNPDLKMNSWGSKEFYRDKTQAEAATDCNLHGEMLFEGEKLAWDMYKKSTAGASLYPSKYILAYRELMNISQQSGQLPLLAYFSDSFPHKQTNLSPFAKQEINNTEGILRNFGYYQWDNDTACTTIWQLRLLDVIIRTLSLNESDSLAKREVDYITNILKQFSRPLNEYSDDSFEINKIFCSLKEGAIPELWLQLKTGEELPFNSLPAGYLRLYSIAFDLAYRSYLLNRNGNLTEIKGLVLIDEVDLHLHPSLALEVVERFKKIFPKIQFIMTTHSPLVITSVNTKDGRSQVLCLVKGSTQPHKMQDMFGIDYNAGLMDGMGVSATNEDIDFLKKGILRAMRRKDNDLVKKKTDELRSIVSADRYEKILSEIQQTVGQTSQIRMYNEMD